MTPLNPTPAKRCRWTGVDRSRIDHPRVNRRPHDIGSKSRTCAPIPVGDIKMPPLARETIDQAGIKLLKDCIERMPVPGSCPSGVALPPVISAPVFT